MILPDWMIEKHIAINPLAPLQSWPGIISYGVTSYGYDVRVGYKFKMFTNAFCGVVDPKKFDSRSFVDVDITPSLHSWYGPADWESPNYRYCHGCKRSYYLPNDPPPEPCVNRNPDHILIPPNSFALAETVEKLVIPRDVLAICVGKSTYARCGIIVNVTPLEPEWQGCITIEISNTTPLPAKIYAGEGIAQIIFLKADASCRTSYADKKGKYQNQEGLTLPKVER